MIQTKTLAESGFSTENQPTHSLRIGVCSTASNRGLHDSQIKAFGRWASKTYKPYIRIPSDAIAM